MSKPKITIASTPVECDALPEGAEPFLCLVGRQAQTDTPQLVGFYMGKLTDIDRPLYRVVVTPTDPVTITLVAWLSHSMSEKPISIGPLGRTMPAFSQITMAITAFSGNMESVETKLVDWCSKWNASLHTPLGFDMATDAVMGDWWQDWAKFV